MTGTSASGTSAMLFPVALFVVSYGIIMTERINRAVVVILAAGIAIAFGYLAQAEAIAAIDFNTLALLTGTMIIVGITKKSGIFGYMAIRAAQTMRASPAGILAALAMVTAVVSAFLPNAATLLFIAPVTFVIAGDLGLPAYPFLLAEIFASNIGGTATLIGDPPNILIGSAAHLTFDDFLLALGPAVLAVFVVQTLLMHLIWGRTLHASREHRARVMALDAREAIVDARLIAPSLAVIAGLILALVFAEPLHLEAGTIALLAAGLLMLFDHGPRPRHEHSETVTSAFAEVDWVTIFFFVGLFVMVAAIAKAGALDYLGRQLLAATGGDLRATALVLLWGGAILSALIDNIPFVITLIPLIKGIAPAMGGDAAILPVWWSLALGACLGGNGTLIGSAANLTVAGIAERSGAPIGFWRFNLAAFPLMLVSIVLCHVYVVWRFF
ncbi:MAG TPA: ArsB/NhaD family transporter [Micropepsaceae bacterium]|nr:ArsB/NhaD family transporter [Micropepsaceae bacterium]